MQYHAARTTIKISWTADLLDQCPRDRPSELLASLVRYSPEVETAPLPISSVGRRDAPEWAMIGSAVRGDGRKRGRHDASRYAFVTIKAARI